MFASRSIFSYIVPVGFCLLTCSCTFESSKSQPTQSSNDRQDQAVKDPMSYSPFGGKEDVSGGSINNFDKEGMKRDLDTVFSP